MVKASCSGAVSVPRSLSRGGVERVQVESAGPWVQTCGGDGPIILLFLFLVCLSDLSWVGRDSRETADERSAARFPDALERPSVWRLSGVALHCTAVSCHIVCLLSGEDGPHWRRIGFLYFWLGKGSVPDSSLLSLSRRCFHSETFKMSYSVDLFLFLVFCCRGRKEEKNEANKREGGAQLCSCVTT